MISENINTIKSSIIETLVKSNRDTNSAELIAVSKTKPVEMLNEAYQAGMRDFGENKVQEILAKYDELPKDIRWHMIGHLQTNKVKYIADKVYMIHSVDSVKLAKEIDKQAKRVNRIIPILIEINIGNEESKYGIKPCECEAFIREINSLPNICISGLMCVAPFTENAEQNRVYFRQMKQLSVDITSKNIDNTNMSVLSMGMSGDYLIALEEGATYVRVGTSVFGERYYNN